MLRLCTKLTLIFVCVIFLTSCESNPIYYEITLDAGNGRKIRIFANKDFDVSRSYYCKIYNKNIVEVPKSFLGGFGPREKPEFLMYKSADQTIIGIYKKGQPNKIIMLHDFSTKENYPHGPDSYDGPESSKLRNKLLLKLQKDFPGVN